MKDNDAADKCNALDHLDKYLWIDPSDKDDTLKGRVKLGAVLLAEDIERYVTNYNVLVNCTDFKCGIKEGAKLKGASYTMTPDPDDAWTFESNLEGNVVETPLKKGRDSNGEYFIVPKNSLVFIRLKQELRIPYYFIGRHNLKIRYVYKGLLLGTGPQVDPGYVGKLIIPLHNFTTDNVSVHIRDSFVSIDFVRTTPFFQDNETGIPENLDDLYARFKNQKCLLERDKVEKRKSLSAYLESSKPQSQMGRFYSDFGDFKTEIRSQIKSDEGKIKTVETKVGEFRVEIEKKQNTYETSLNKKWEQKNRWKAFEMVAAFAVIFVALNLYRLYERDVETTSLDLNRALLTTNLLNVANQLERMNSDNTEFKKTVSVQLNESNTLNSLSLTDLRNTVARLETEVRALQNNSHTTNALPRLGATNTLNNP
jgi:deoxycytidine triphosphate deaminase